MQMEILNFKSVRIKKEIKIAIKFCSLIFCSLIFVSAITLNVEQKKCFMCLLFVRNKQGHTYFQLFEKLILIAIISQKSFFEIN